MKKYLKYAREALRTGGIKLFMSGLWYFLFKKVPHKPMTINNPVMGIFQCRSNTTDFMYTFFSYEYKIKEYIRDAISEYDVFIDVGACIGDYSIWLAKNQLRCISFEPNKDNYTCLVDNIKLNYLEKSIKTYNHGLGRKSEKVLFEIHPLNKGYSGKYSTFEDGEKQVVDIKVFDRIFKNLDVHHHQAFIMKIDAEGMESEIIAGAKEFLSGAKKVLLIFEAHTHMKKIEAELSKITEIQLTPLDELNVAVTIDNTNKPTTLRTANTCDNYGNKPKDL